MIGLPVKRFAFTGQEYDSDAGLYYYNARWYNPGTCKFLSEDPIEFAAGDANLTRYVGNSVTNAVDPSRRIKRHSADGKKDNELKSLGSAPLQFEKQWSFTMGKWHPEIESDKIAIIQEIRVTIKENITVMATLHHFELVEIIDKNQTIVSEVDTWGLPALRSSAAIAPERS